MGRQLCIVRGPNWGPYIVQPDGSVQSMVTRTASTGQQQIKAQKRYGSTRGSFRDRSSPSENVGAMNADFASSRWPGKRQGHPQPAGLCLASRQWAARRPVRTELFRSVLRPDHRPRGAAEPVHHVPAGAISVVPVTHTATGRVVTPHSVLWRSGRWIRLNGLLWRQDRRSRRSGRLADGFLALGRSDGRPQPVEPFLSGCYPHQTLFRAERHQG
jgi:hypothetical protein